jgi:glycosyltransferase involved in cell wall biosynthesis
MKVFESKKKLAIITTHPIQYNAPLFRLLTERGNIRIKVFYTWGQTKDEIVFDPNFKKSFKWDIPLIDGYDHEFIHNHSSKPGTTHFKGIINKDLIHKIDAYDPDALLVYGWAFQSHLQILRHYKKKIKIFFRGDSTLLNEPDGFSIRKIARRFMLRWIYSHVNIAFYVGTSNKLYFLKHGLKENQLVYAPHAVENDRFTDGGSHLEEYARAERKTIGIEDSQIAFHYAGKFYAIKHLDLLIKSFRQLKKDNICLLLTGGGEDEADLKKLAGNDKRIFFQSFKNQSEMPWVYRMGDVFILPSKSETWGLGINEAMACGRSVIMSDKCGCAADLNIGNNSVFSSGDQAMLVQLMNKYIDQGRIHLQQMTSSIQHQILPWSLDNVVSSIEKTVLSI